MKKKKRTQMEMFSYIEQWHNSGLNKTEFCREQGFFIDAFYYWEQKYLKEVEPKSPADSQINNFVLIAVDQTTNPVDSKSDNPILEISYSNGTLVRIYQPLDSQMLTTLLQQ